MMFIRGFLAFIFLLSLFLSCSTSFSSAAEPIQIRALSLKTLQKEVMNRCKGDGSCPEIISNMADVKKITGYVLDKRNRDIILIGEINPKSPPILLEDFVVALRNAWFKYTALEGNVRYYSNPGCSIDPNPQIISKLQSINDESLDLAISKWEQICQNPQKVRVLGIPFDSHFSFIMVKADYDMKNIVNGSDQLKLIGFNSLMDLKIRKFANSNQPGSSMSRFWFYPGENRYAEDSGIVRIDKSKVILLTEEEYLNNSGTIVGKSRPDPLAREFCRNFSERYDEIASNRPIYIQLQNLFHLSAVSKIIKMKSAHNDAGLSLTYLLDRYSIPFHEVDKQMPGISCVRKIETREDFADRYAIYQSAFQTCGGVGMDLKIQKRNFTKDKTGKLSVVRSAVLNSRPSQESLYWDVAPK